MKQFLVIVLLATLASCVEQKGVNRETESVVEQSDNIESKDVLIHRENHTLNFTIISGNGAPILFESGAGDDGSVWKSIAREIHHSTGAPIIMYDRSGFGKSTLDTSNSSVESHGVLQNLSDLEYGLKQLGFDKEIQLVAHSYGSYLAYLYANKHPGLVKSVVAIDVVHKFHADGWAEKINKEMTSDIEGWRISEPGMYYLMMSLPAAADLIAELNIPEHIPVIDVMPKTEVDSTNEGAVRWQKCHKEFVQAHPKAKTVIIEDAGHYIWRDKPEDIVEVIVESWLEQNR